MDTSIDMNFPHALAKGQHKCHCWCMDWAYKRQSPHSGDQQNRCSTGTHTPPSLNLSSTHLCQSIQRFRHNCRFLR